MMKKTVTVVIPTYNRSREVVGAITSVLRQRDAKAKIIVVDDGSTDDTCERIRKAFGNTIEFLTLSHSGLPAVARNAGLARVQTKYVAFLDSDDQWAPDKLKKQLAILSHTNMVGVGTNAWAISDGHRHKIYKTLPPSVGFRELIASNTMICSSFVGRTSLLKRLGGFPTEARYRAYEDWLLWIRLSTCGRIAFVDEPLVTYRDEPTESVRSHQVSWESIHTELQTDIIRWGIRSLWFHPVRHALIHAMWIARKYSKHD